MSAGLNAANPSHLDVPRQHDRLQAGRKANPLQLKGGVSCLFTLITRIARFSSVVQRCSSRIGLGEFATAQTNLPEIKVVATKKKPPPTRPTRRVATPPTTAAPRRRTMALATQTATFDQARNNIYAPVGTAPHDVSHDAIAAMPQGTNAPVEKVLLQLPGITQDFAASGNFHVRNEHGNVAIRINGIMLPDGVSGFGTFLDSALIGKMSLITGALPAQYGFRTSGVLDIKTRSDAFNNTGSAGFYAGSRGTLYAELRIWRHGRTDRSISSPAAISRTTSASRIRRRTGARSTTTPSRSAALATSRQSSTPTPASA